MTHKDIYTLNTMITGYIDNQNCRHISKETNTHNAAIKAYCEKKDTITTTNITIKRQPAM